MDIECAGAEALFLGLSIFVFGALHALIESGILRRKI